MPLTPTRKTHDRREAHELVQRSGIPFPAALRVVRGEATLDQVLKQLLNQEVRRSLEARGMPPALAGQVAKGFLGEGKAWDAFRAMQHPSYAPERSLLKEACAAGQELALELFGEGTVLGVPTQVDKYDFHVAGAGGAERTIHKHDVKWAAPVEAVDLIRGCRTVVDELARLGLKGSREMKDRLRLERSEKLDLLDRNRRLRLVCRDGDVLVGTLVWASRYELGLRLADDAGRSAEVDVFAHSLLRIEDVASGRTVASLERDVAPGGPARSAEPGSPKQHRDKGRPPQGAAASEKHRPFKARHGQHGGKPASPGRSSAAPAQQQQAKAKGPGQQGQGKGQAQAKKKHKKGRR